MIQSDDDYKSFILKTYLNRHFPFFCLIWLLAVLELIVESGGGGGDSGSNCNCSGVAVAVVISSLYS